MKRLAPFARLSVLISTALSFPWLEAQTSDVRISEFMASNDTVFPDNADFDDYSDWIELHNAGTGPVSLDGYFLTDDLTLPAKWAFPAGASIPAGGYLVVRADGFNAGPGETHSRGYYPWGSTFTTRRYHTSFKLSADGEAVGLFRAETPTTQTTLIAENSTWLYRDLGTDPGNDWMTKPYDDSSWLQGAGVLGYGDNFIDTTVDSGPSTSNKYATTHYRYHFNVANPASIGNVILELMADDGAVVYLNGTEVGRLRIDAGPVAFDDYSGNVAPSENVYEALEVGTFPLVAGDNVLAVEVHQASGNSSDTSFDLRLFAEEVAGPIEEVDSVTYGVQRSDISYGRNSSSDWVPFCVPTPGAANDSATLVLPAVAADEVSASVDSGFYDEGQAVSLSAGGAGTIRYTLDGSDPTTASPEYTAPIDITATTILRARVFEDGLKPGPVLMRSYFLGADAAPGFPVISFVADPETLFGDEIGIYENDTPYPHKGREVPVQLEFFEQDQSLAFAVNAGTRIAGENIWEKPQKPFNIYCRGKYGDDSIGYQLFPGEPAAAITEFNLRNGGDDWEETLLRDAMMPEVLTGQMNASLYTYRPTSLFLNGQYWGVYNIRKRLDPSYFANEHFLQGHEFDFVQYAHNENGTTVLHAEEGSTERYEALLNLVTANNPSDPAIYDQVKDQVEIDSFIDYVVATDFAFNTSWSHNREFWSPTTPGAKWRWVINDFDRGFDATALAGSSSKSLIDDFAASYTLFQRLDNNSEFVDRLLQRYAAHVGSTFHPARFNAIFDGIVAEQEPGIARHISRWSSSGGFSATKRQNEIAEIKQYVADRPTTALPRLQQYLNVSRTMADVTLAASPANGGSIKVAGVPMELGINSVVSLFENTPVELTAVPAPGFSFVSWSNGSTDSSIVVTLSGAESLTANFTGGAATVLAGAIGADTVMSAANSPYVITGDLIVEAGATLTIDAGVEVLMAEGASVLVYGTLDANGTEAEPISFHSLDGSSWGNLGFKNTATTSELSHVIIRDATVSHIDPLNLKGAVSGYHAEILLDHLDILGPEPVFARFGSTTLLDSRINITFTGDGINIKKGAGHVERCTFTGNTSVDTDAIDYDGVIDGIIRDNRIYAFRGDNSDGIDVGEGCVNLLLENNRIYNNSDKGVSVGQASEVIMRQNLIVGCVLGVGIKDAGSIARMDQNTFVRNDVGVAVYEKNLDGGGGAAEVENCIFSRSKDAPVTVDSLSTLTTTYSLSDTLAIPGSNNLIADPLFTSPGIYDFSLQAASPAIDAGDPAHAPDPDTTRADVGMAYVYDPLDYPFLPPNVIVINELLSSSPAGQPDWIELHNSGSEPIDLGGWYLSDSGSDLQKYRIADGTVIPGGGYLVFTEDANFGVGSTDPGALTPFALSANGETAYVFKPAEGLDLDYLESEDFGPGAEGVTFGRYFKESSGTFNFVAMSSPTPGSANSLPLVGPIVISEIMYHPDTNGDAEYLELLNISSAPVTLYDAESGAAWAITNGIDYTFPTGTPVTMQPGERILLVRNLAIFNATYGSLVPGGTQVFQWTAGGLSNSGETLELSKPGGLDDLLVRQYIRQDRVNFLDQSPWPVEADGAGSTLERINNFAYGNDFANWAAASATPGTPETLDSFTQWALDTNLPGGLDGPDDDADGDGLANVLEYALGTPPLSSNNGSYWSLSVGGDATVRYAIPGVRDDLLYGIEVSATLAEGSWTSADFDLVEDGGSLYLQANVATGERLFFRLVVARR